MTDATAPSGATGTTATESPHSKGKGKATAEEDVSMGEEEEDDEEDEEEDEEEEEEEDDEEVDDDLEEIDPKAIVPRKRRAAAKRIDYTSEEALKKAGLTKDDLEKDDEKMDI